MTVGDAYIAQITASAADRRARSAFCELAMSLAVPDTEILDFGAGPGIDAKFYAEHGYKVFAYDVDPRMHESLLRHCKEQIAAGRIIPYVDGNRSFSSSTAVIARTKLALITANFAPLSLIDDPREVFRQFHELTSDHGQVLLSVLNPYFIGDMKYGWWWKNVIRLIFKGEYSIPGGTGRIFRRSPFKLKAAAERYFKLHAVIRGLPGAWHQRRPLRWPFLATSQFLFLLFQKRP